MKMSRIVIQPFLSGKDTADREVAATPRLLSRSRKTSTHIDKLRLHKRETGEQEEPRPFDDSFCFREGNRLTSTNLTLS
jgi:hypothetical protein